MDAILGDHRDVRKVGSLDAHDAIALLREQLHRAEIDLDLGDVVDEGHGLFRFRYGAADRCTMRQRSTKFYGSKFNCSM